MRRYQPSRDEFRALAQRGNLIPVHREIIADLETPVSAFMKIDESDHAFLLESVEGGENLARYSFLGSDPRLVFSSRRREVAIRRRGGETETRTCERPLDLVRDLMRDYHPVEDPDLPPFIGGMVGYMGYDVVRDYERLPDENPDTLGVPDILFLLADTMLVFDHVKHRIILLANAHVEGEGEAAADAAYDDAVGRIEAMAARLSRPAPMRPEPPEDQPIDLASFESNFSRPEYMRAVEKCREYILAGDIFQVVLSQRLRIPYHCPSFDIYRALRAINPSPYMFYLKFPEVTLAGSSPEILIRVTDGRVQLRPIAGTRPRGRDRAEDAALERELLADPKERAEHVMLVDLGRNDAGRVCRYGSVGVDEMMVIERYSHVMHIVSNVAGDLAEDRDAYDALAASFPAGTVSGAPKIRAMEIIDELETERRGPYAGAVGYFSFNGNLDTCIILRTFILKDNVAYVQAGAGIVADSVPASEYEETLRKAHALLSAVNVAHGGLQ